MMRTTSDIRKARGAALLAVALAGAASAFAAAEGLDGGIAIKSQEAAPVVPILESTAAVAWVKAPIRIDGELGDWAEAGIPPLSLAGPRHATWFQGRYAGPGDCAATLRLARDDQHLYAALEITDDRAPAPERVEFAFADARTPLITGWRDVGMRYAPDDLHTLFVIRPDGTVGIHWAHVQQRMDFSVVQNSFGTETERRVFLQEGGADAAFEAKIFSRAARREEGGRTVTVFEVAFPWKNLVPYDPVSYAPLKFNVAVHDRDEGAEGIALGAVGWMPGLVGTYSAAHFVNLAFEPPAGRTGVDLSAQVPQFHYLNNAIPVGFSFYNHGTAKEGELRVATEPAGTHPPVVQKVSLPSGYSRKTVALHSEKVGLTNFVIKGTLALAGGEAQAVKVFAPTHNDHVTVQPMAEVLAEIAGLERNYQSLSNLYGQVKARKLDTAYPLAYLTLQQMFIPRCREDLGRGDSVRVLRNTALLKELYAKGRDYMEAILKDPGAQLRVPPRIDPAELRMKDGYYWAGRRPTFLWGPCTFWYLRQDQPLVGQLGFNSVCPELPHDNANTGSVAHLENWRRMGISMNASMNVPNLQAVGTSPYLKQHPEMANLDPNNFLPFLVQHPAAREAIAEGFRTSIAFWKDKSGIRSYWLWNEPWYVNYSETTRRDFIAWLKPRYRTIEALNRRWRSAYADFDEIRLIQWPDAANYAPWYDFQQFRDQLLADFFGFLATTAKALDPDRPLHVKYMAASLHSFNMEKFQGLFDIAGHDGSISDRDIVFLDYCKSVYPDHPLVNTEVHIAYGGRAVVSMVAWRLALHGLADGNWWCWHSNSRFSDSLGNVESMYALAFSGLDLQRLFHPHVHALNTKPRPVATLFPDVVERRSDLKMVRIRHELGKAQYALGLQPFYATEDRVAQGELEGRKVVLAGESDFVRDATYQGVLDYARQGGLVIVTRGGFARNEYGDPRDAGELVKPGGGEPYGEGARIYPVGKGRVICIDAMENKHDVVLDGGQVLREEPLAEHHERRRIYQRVLARVLADNGLKDPVRLAAATDDPDALYGFDWRNVKVDGGYTLAVLPYQAKPPFAVKLETDRPVRRIVNLIENKDVPLAEFAIAPGPNLFRIELDR